MNKNMLFALLLIALSVIIMIMNRSSVNINVLGLVIHTIQSFAILAFVAIGVAIGVMLK